MEAQRIVERVPLPASGRTFSSVRRIRLADRDADGRVRLDALARYLQDVAIDDVDETGWGAPEHLWVLRSIQVEVIRPLRADREVELVTWCSALAPLAAGRRLSVRGDAGGSVEADSVWIHLGPDARPARIEDFGAYAEAAQGRAASTRLALPGPPEGAEAAPWPLRATDVDVFGHVNNAAYWHAVEQLLPATGPDPRRPLRAQLDHRHPIDLGEAVVVRHAARDGGLDVALEVAGSTRARARVEPL
ncbi:MAG TPA: acyl-ACP thioesterase domain-containing protein [Gaiellaceae bacterium]|nr:acyl-ACP thioesterase domain-containing protein [Gaiellaceae bacterium]